MKYDTERLFQPDEGKQEGELNLSYLKQ